VKSANPNLAGNLVLDLHVDHDHITGALRGLLCSACNTGLGFFRDHPELLKRAIEYLNQSADVTADALRQSRDPLRIHPLSLKMAARTLCIEGRAE